MSHRTPGNPYHLEPAALQWESGDVPLARDYNDIYYAREQGLAETQYVFLQHNRLAQRWARLPAADSVARPVFTIAETGFGTGLNCLAAWQLWRRTAPPGWRLCLISTEQHPLRREDLRRALAAWPELSPLAQVLLDNYPVLVPGHHLISLEDDAVDLHLLLGDAGDCLAQLRASDRDDWPPSRSWQVDAWFLDGFAPARNPGLWHDDLYRVMSALSGPGTTLATFTAVGEVRRGLTRSGFTMHKVPGFASKREMLHGEFRERPDGPTPTTGTETAAWHLDAAGPTAPTRHVAVIGGGLAGCHSARALARRGIRVTLVEAAPQLAGGASGNPLGMLYTKLSPQAGILNRFTLTSYLFALRLYHRMAGAADSELFDFCGVLQLAGSDRERRLFDRLQTVFGALPELVRFLDPARASAVAGVPVSDPAWFFPGAGWARPPDLCQHLIDHPAIEVVTNCPVTALDRAHRWQLRDADDTVRVEADAVILANSAAATHFPQSQWLPLKTIRGQLTLAPASDTSRALSTVICHEGYLSPAVGGRHHLGATFDLDDDATDVREDDHRRNLETLAAALPGLLPATDQPLSGRAGVRCATPDYLPLAGPLPVLEDFRRDYAPLRKNARTRIDTAGSYHPGLYINAAHGSRGLTSTPLCAELLAARIAGEPPPLEHDLQRALNPARFIIRDLIRNRI